MEGKIQAAGLVHESNPAHTSHKHRATYTMGLDISAQVISARVGGVPGRVADGDSRASSYARTRHPFPRPLVLGVLPITHPHIASRNGG